MRRFRIGVVASVAGALLALSTALPAAAHDQLISSDPAEGARLAAAPSSVSLEFSADVLTIGAAVIVVDATGHDWVVGEPVIEHSVVTATLGPDMPDAGYEIRWQVVSGDGHPISGIIPFTIGDGEPLVRDPLETSTADPLPAQDGQRSSGAIGPWRPVLIAALGAATAVALVASIQFLRRRTRGGAPGPAPSSASDSDDQH